MKKILTLMVMFAMTAGILSTQAQSLSYQVVVRDVNNNLVVNQDLTVDVTIVSGQTTYYEKNMAKTNLNGMLSLTIGVSEYTPEPAEKEIRGSLSDIQWNNAKISLNFNNTNIRNVAEEIVRPVPYALEAKFLLTTPMIVNYISEMSANQDNQDWARIYTALRNNEDFFNAMRDTVVEYVKANYPIARSIAFHYLSNLTPKDVKDAYDTIKDVLKKNEKLDSMLNVVMMDYLRNHRAMAFELAEYYAQHANARDVQKFYDAAMSNQEVVDPIMDSILIVFLKEFGLDPACMAENNYTSYCQVLDAASNLGNMGTCTGITNVKNSVDDGLIALYENRGVIYTAYIKNFASYVSDPALYGFEQSEVSFDIATSDDITTYPATYHPITDRFGKFEYLMDNTSTCGKTLYVRAFAHFTDTCNNYNDSIQYSEMTVVIPGFEISIVAEGNTLKATFDSQEARDAFNIKKDNIVWTDANNVVLGKGLTYEIPVDTQIAYPIKATAHLGQCEHFDTISGN